MVSHMLGNALCLMHALEPLQVLALEPLAVVESAVPAGVCLVLGPGLRGDVACARAAELSVRKPIGPASTYQLALSLLPLPHGFLLAVSTAAWQVAGQTLCLPFARWPTASYGENSTKPHAKQPPDIHSRLGGTPVGSVAEGRTARRRGRAQRALPPPPTAGALRLMVRGCNSRCTAPVLHPPGPGLRDYCWSSMPIWRSSSKSAGRRSTSMLSRPIRIRSSVLARRVSMRPSRHFAWACVLL